MNLLLGFGFLMGGYILVRILVNSYFMNDFLYFGYN